MHIFTFEELPQLKIIWLDLFFIKKRLPVISNSDHGKNVTQRASFVALNELESIHIHEREPVVMPCTCVKSNEMILFAYERET